jgi:hypothetical protein
MTRPLDPSTPLEVRRGIGGKPPPEVGPRLLRLDLRESRLFNNEASRLLLEVCGRLASFFLLLLELGLDEESEPPPEEDPRLLRRDLRESRLLNETLRLLLEVCGKLTSFFLLLLDLGLDEERFGERELSEDRLSNLCSSLDKTSIVEWPSHPVEDPRGGMPWRIEEDRRGGMTWQLHPPSPLEVRRGIGGEPPPEEGPRLLRLDLRESRLLNEALRLLLEVCGRLTSSFVLVLDLGLGEESFVEKELSEDRLCNRCSSLVKRTIVECRSFC